MKQVIWKHLVELTKYSDRYTLHLPKGAVVLHFASQHDQLCLWEAHLDGETSTERRTFQLVGTGHPADVDPGRHVGTVLVSGGNFVWHLFEVTEEEP